MRLFSRVRDYRFCAYCRSQRRLYVKKHIDLTNVLIAIVFALAVTYAVWSEAEPRGLIFFCIFVSAAEAFVYVRWRVSLVCRMCGFDPIIYKKSPEQAAQRVREFFQEHAEDPEFWLTKSPLLEVHREIRERERRKLRYKSLSKISHSVISPATKTSALTPSDSV